jgi:hypothetical protein
LYSSQFASFEWSHIDCLSPSLILPQAVLVLCAIPEEPVINDPPTRATEEDGGRRCCTEELNVTTPDLTARAHCLVRSSLATVCHAFVGITPCSL